MILRDTSWLIGLPCYATQRVVPVALCLLLSVLAGCAAVTNPVANGIPVTLLPPELLVEPKNHFAPIPLAALRRPPPKHYRLGSGDVLGVYIGGVLGERDRPPPVHEPGRAGLTPAVGYPIPIRDDGTVALPLVEPINVAGKTIAEAEAAIIEAYTVQQKVINPAQTRVMVTLMEPRETRVLVIREDAADTSTTTALRAPLRGVLGELATPRLGVASGEGFVVDLPAYENDVLTALTKTGGMPGEMAATEVIIHRGWFSGAYFASPFDVPRDAVVRIPITVRPGEPLPFDRDDVILQPGDILMVPGRSDDVYYTAGLLPTGEFPLPRDRDLGVVEAIARVGGPIINGGFGGSNLSGSIVNSGIGNPSPSLVTVLRNTPQGMRVPIRINLERALRDRREDLLLQAGDVVLLQETPSEALARYMSNVFGYSIISRVIERGSTVGAVSANGP